MKNYVIGGMISLSVFVLLLIVNEQIYHRVMALNVPITLLVLHIIVYKHFIPKKRYAAYSLFVLVMAISLFFSLPELTHQKAQEKILASYEIKLIEMGTLPIQTENPWNPFASNWAYAFTGVSLETEEQISFLVMPDTGKILEIGS